MTWLGPRGLPKGADVQRQLEDDARTVVNQVARNWSPRPTPDDVEWVAKRIALDIGGTTRSSEGFADHLSRLMLDGRSHIVFVLGGAAGLDDGIVGAADERLTLGPLTLPHQLARVVLLEQVYRAFRIMRGEPYHR